MATTLWGVFILLALGCGIQHSEGNNSPPDPVKLRMKRSLGDSITKKTWKVTSILSEPYLLMDPVKSTYTGFIPDLLQMLSERLGVTFDIYLVPDGKYGSANASGIWNGMIGEVIKMEKGQGGADMAAAAITMTSGRERVVNFIKPFQNLGLTIITKKPPAQFDTPASALLNGLGYDVWIACFLGLVVVSVVMWLMNRFNPYEWGSRYDIGRATEDDAQAYSITGALWSTFSTLTWQGYEKSPRSSAGKLLMSIWFLFVTITLATYTASLVSNIMYFRITLGKHPRNSPIKDLDHLVSQSEVQYGTIPGGSTYRYITNAPGAEFDRIRAYFKTDEGKKNLLRSTSDGIERVRNSNGDFAFIMESMTAKYYANNKPCNLMTVGEPFALRSYGMVVPHNVNLDVLDSLHAAILQLREEGEIETLERKWWNHKGECWIENMNERDASKPVGMFKPGLVGLSVFWPAVLLLVVGIVASAIVGLVEIVYFKMRGKFDDVNRPNDERLKEIHT